MTDEELTSDVLRQLVQHGFLRATTASTLQITRLGVLAARALLAVAGEMISAAGGDKAARSCLGYLHAVDALLVESEGPLY